MKYCQSISDELTFDFNKIVPCCNCYSFKAPEYLSLESKEPNEISFEEMNIIDIKKNIIQNLDENIENFSCKNCIHLKDDDNVSFDDIVNKKYTAITLRHWTSCNSNCVHCDNHRSNEFGKPPIYNPLQFIKKAYENNLIDTENLVVRFQGGDLGVLENFDEYIDLFQKFGFKIIHFSTNNIIYQPKIAQILKEGKGSLNVSLDAGTKETYNKIKRVDKFNEVIENLKKYLETGIHPDAISIHYIIIQNYNDNKNEIKNFLKLMKKIGISTIGIRIDHKDLDSYLLGKSPIEVINKYKKLVTYFYNEAKKLNFKLDNDECVEQNFAFTKFESGIIKEDKFFLKTFFTRFFS